jgi:hypothetical protein
VKEAIVNTAQVEPERIFILEPKSLAPEKKGSLKDFHLFSSLVSKLDGGVGKIEEILLWAFKGALMAFGAQMLQGRLKASVFGNTGPTNVEVNLGVLPKDGPVILLYGHFSPVLKQKIADKAKRQEDQSHGGLHGSLCSTTRGSCLSRRNAKGNLRYVAQYPRNESARILIFLIPT